MGWLIAFGLFVLTLAGVSIAGAVCDHRAKKRGTQWAE